jgi:hypothetical protein
LIDLDVRLKLQEEIKKDKRENLRLTKISKDTIGPSKIKSQPEKTLMEV